MIYEIKSKTAVAKFNSFGAELISLNMRGEEKLWQNKDGKWDGHCPVLFPVCGHVEFIFGGKSYDVPAHGFAMNKEFVLVKQKANKIEFSLKYDDETLKIYPFKFDFRVKYCLKKSTLKIEYNVINLDDKTLYFSCGGHESFALSGLSDEYKLKFNKEEVFVNYCNDDNGYLTGKTEILGQGDELVLKDKYFEQSLSLIFKNLNSKKVKLIKKDKEIAQISFKGFNVLLAWKEYGSEFICIEPWRNLPDCVFGTNDTIANKFGFIAVKKGKAKKLSQNIKYFV